MARKTATCVIPHAGRDQGKHFLLTEMAAVPAERWATRVIKALTAQGAAELERFFSRDIEDVAAGGMASFAALGLSAFAKIDDFLLEPLLEEMMTCVEYVPDPSKPDIRLAWPLAQDQVEEVSTILFLRSEVVALHVGFSIAGLLSIWNQARLARRSNGENTPTSDDKSEALSPAA